MSRWRTRAAVVAVGIACAAGLSACGSSSKPSGSTAPTTAAATTAAAASASASGPAPGTQTITVTPDKGLKEGQTVQVKAANFPPNESLGINECADKGASTGAGDCNIAKIVLVTADATGKVSGKIAVTKGPFGANNVTCSAKQKCLISVSQLIPGNPLAASKDISFA
jgi:hypothetical protein